MLVRDIMKPTIIIIRLGTRWRDVARELVTHNVSGAPVVDEQDHLVGVVSEKDLFRALYPTYHDWYETPHAFLDFEDLERTARDAADHPVEHFMSRRLITVTADMPILQAGAWMVATGIHRIPVLEDQRLVGIVGRHEIFQSILKQYYDI